MERIIFREVERDLIFQYGYARNTFYLFIGPLIYTYIRRLLFYKNGRYRLGYIHYLPALLYFSYSLFHIYIYDSIQDFDRYRYLLLFWIEVTFFISIATYLIKSKTLLNYYHKNEKHELSFNQTIVQYVKILLACLLVYTIFWFLGILERFVIELPINISLVYDISCLIFGIQIYIVGFYSLKHPEVFKIRFLTKNDNEPIVKHSMKEEEVSKISDLVDAYFNEKKGHRRTDLSLSVLANEINTTTNKLSWVLNNVYEKTFYELVNEYRVDDFLQSIKENKHKEFTVVSIALDVGFNSKSTFYKAFKEIMKATPTAYIKSIESKQTKHSA
ncbi:MAG: helix-turn-helix domain-containing protein [Thermonemataceae bacterium]